MAIPTAGLLIPGCLGQTEHMPSSPSNNQETNQTDSEYQLHSSPWKGWRLETSSQSYDIDEPVVVKLSNITDQQQYTGNNRKYNIYKLHNGSFESVYTSTEAVPFTDEAVIHSPGEGFQWRIEITKKSVTKPKEEFDIQTSLLGAGRYRFIYWGVGDGNGAIFTGFTIKR